MDRRDFVRMGAGALGVGALPNISSTVTQSANGIELATPTFSNSWSSNPIVSPETADFWYDGVIKTHSELHDRVTEVSSDAPHVYSYFATTLSYQGSTPLKEPENPDAQITLGGGPIPGSVSLGKVESLFRDFACSGNPLNERVTTRARELYLSEMSQLHGYEDSDPDEVDGLRKPWSPACVRRFKYHKPAYTIKTYTFETKWNSPVGDDLPNFKYRGLLSIERAKDGYLLVGGMVIDDAIDPGILKPELISNAEELQSDLVSKMEVTTLRQQ